MKYIKKGLYLFVILAVGISCNRGIKIKETYADGNPKIIEEYTKDDQGREILRKETHYFPGEGKKKYISGTYDNAQLRDGIWTSWYENGQKNSEQNYVNGKEDGEYNAWHPNGNQYIKGKYEMGKKVGMWTFYDTSGNVMREVNFDAKSP